MKKLSIIIPFKGQKESDLAIPLSSINNQIGVDFNEIDIHLVNDGGPPINIAAFDILANLTLHYHELAVNVGAGLARQYGIDQSEGEYIMFMDSDDELHFAGALLEFFNVVQYEGNHQLIIARYIEQFKAADGSFRYLTHPLYDWKSSVAKWFKRRYLLEEGLRFHPELRIFEDTYFVGLACTLAEDIHYLDSVVYTWRWNGDSTTRSDGHSFEYQTHIWALESRLYLQKLREKQPNLVKKNLENYVADVYMRYTRFPPVDEAAFWAEHQRLLTEFRIFWSISQPELQARVNALRDTEGGLWYGVQTGGFSDFLSRSFRGTERKVG